MGWPEAWWGAQQAPSYPAPTGEDGHVETPCVADQCPWLLIDALSDVSTKLRDLVPGIFGEHDLQVGGVETQQVFQVVLEAARAYEPPRPQGLQEGGELWRRLCWRAQGGCEERGRPN